MVCERSAADRQPFVKRVIPRVADIVRPAAVARVQARSAAAVNRPSFLLLASPPLLPHAHDIMPHAHTAERYAPPEYDGSAPLRE